MIKSKAATLQFGKSFFVKNCFQQPDYYYGVIIMRNKILEVGKITNTHALKGEVKVLCWTDSPRQFEEFEYLYAGINERIKLYFERVRYQKNNLIIKFKGIDSIEQAEELKNRVLLADRDQLGEPDGYYICDILGIKVYTINDEYLGEITDVFATGSNDVYVVTPPKGNDILIPVIDEVVKEVDIDKNIAVVELIKGLMD